MILKYKQIKISELANITGQSIPLISRYFKTNTFENVTRNNGRIIGISPEAVQKYLQKVGMSYLYKPCVILFANLCGGVGKTSGTSNLAVASRRITNRLEIPHVYVDSDPQGSFTTTLFGNPASNSELVLIDFLENKASIDDILTNIGDNTWFVKSNLNQIWIDRILTKPKEIKNGMLRFYQALFEKLGPNTRIFQDHTPQLGTLFASSVCAIHQLNKDILRCLMIPIRGDTYAIQGGEYILQEIEELQDTFSLKNDIDIHYYFSSIDRRVSTTSEALRIAKEKDNIVKHLSPVVVRYCSEIPKSIMQHCNVFANRTNNKAAIDYQDLLQYIFDYKAHKTKENG